MSEFPHHYRVSAAGGAEGEVNVSSAGLPALSTSPPPQFGGDGDQWSPETLFVAAVADCFVLTFRSVARASGLEWESLHCDVEGLLDRQERTTRFTRFEVRPVLRIADESKRDRAERCLEKAERACLITSSLTAEVALESRVETADAT